jgi:hypothetical protein
MLNHSDETLWYATILSLIFVLLVTGYGLGNFQTERTAECSVTLKDGFGNKHVWLTRCEL